MAGGISATVYSNEESPKRHELTTKLNGYNVEFLDDYKHRPFSSSSSSSYHEKIANILNSERGDEVSRRQMNAKLIKDRRSFYDNYEEEVVGADMKHHRKNNYRPLYKTEKLIHIEAAAVKHERDDFDDLIDLTHRIPKKVFKKINLSESMSGHSQQAAVGRLPPLPYSFVNLDRHQQQRHKIQETVKSSSTPTANKNHVPKNTTRLFIPLGKFFALKSLMNNQSAHPNQMKLHADSYGFNRNRLS